MHELLAVMLSCRDHLHSPATRQHAYTAPLLPARMNPRCTQAQKRTRAWVRTRGRVQSSQTKLPTCPGCGTGPVSPQGARPCPQLWPSASTWTLHSCTACTAPFSGQPRAQTRPGQRLTGPNLGLMGPGQGYALCLLGPGCRRLPALARQGPGRAEGLLGSSHTHNNNSSNSDHQRRKHKWQQRSRGRWGLQLEAWSPEEGGVGPLQSLPSQPGQVGIAPEHGSLS